MVISNTNIDELLNYLKGDKPLIGVYSKVKFKHPKKTKGKIIETTFGRVLFNSLLPEDYPFINEPVNRKKLRKILLDIHDRYGEKVYDEVVRKIQKYSSIFSTICPATIEISGLDLPDEIKEKFKKELEEAKKLGPVEYDKKIEELYHELHNYLISQGVTFFEMVKSGTKGKPSDLQQLFISWGSAYQPLSDETPIVEHSLLEGLTPEELYYGANKARYAAYLKSINVAPIGYFARKMRWALADVKLSDIEDCKTTKYLEMKVDEKNVKTIIGRYYFDEEKRKLDIITEETADKLIGKVIKIRSPLFCLAKDGICKTCYGKLAEQLKNKDIGLTSMEAMHNVLLNRGMKLTHHKLTAKSLVNFKEELSKWFEE
jgi:DNA-directed RNA polymerase subunit beta'